MSFSLEIKNELIELPIDNECCALAELAAIVRTAGSLALSRGGYYIEIAGFNIGLKKRVDALLKMLYNAAASTLASEKSIGKYLYTFSISKVLSPSILTDCGILRYDNIIEGIDEHLFLCPDCKKAYIRGAFLGGGSANIPKSEANQGGFNAEIVHNSEKFIDDFLRLCEETGITFKKSSRAGKFGAYLKSKDSFCDLLLAMTVPKSLQKALDIVVLRDIRGKTNRTTNCINANIEKSVLAKMKQIVAINRSIEDGRFEAFNEKVKEAARLRLEYPDEDLDVLADQLGISKSGLRHRLDKVTALYD